MKILINKKILFISFIVLLFLISIIFTGCISGYSVFLKQYEIGTLVYAENVDAYISDRNVYYQGTIKDFIAKQGEDSDVSFTPEYPELCNENLWILTRDNDSKVDVVIQTTKGLAFGNDAAFIDNIENSRNSMFYYLHAPLNNSRIFSSLENGAYYEPTCSNKNCIGTWDSWDGCTCSFSMTPSSYITLDHEITNQDYIDNGACIACWEYVLESYDDASNTYNYYAVNNCSCQGIPFGEGISYGFYLNYLISNANQENQSTTISALMNIDELIIDGFDFNLAYQNLKNLDISQYPYAEIKDPNDFSYMFADLPVETITLKNIKGQDKIKDLSHMFENCDNLKTINWGNFFENLQPTNLSNMFFNCPNLKNINLSGLDTSKVTDMSNMFNIHASQGQLIEEFIQSSAFNAVFPTNIPTEYKNINNIYQLNLIGDIEDLISYLKCFNLNPFTGLPITYSELVEIYMGKPYEEVLQDIITANSISQEDAIILIQNNVDEQLNSLLDLYPDEEITTSLITDKQLLDIINNFTPNGTLDISGFIINENTDTTNMFGNACNFANIQGPSYVANGIEINLPFNYIANEKNTKSINSQNSNSLFEYTKEPIQEPEEPDEPNPDNPNPDEPDNPNTPQTPKDKNLALYISLGIIGGIIILISIIAIIILIKRKNKTNITNDSDNSEQNK